MDYITRLLGAAIIGAAILLASFLYKTDAAFQGIASPTSYGAASSTVFSVGHQLSTAVLPARGDRGYALFCNGSANRTYLSFSATAITATTSADALIPANGCYEINDQNLYTGVVQALSETATTTTFIVTELLNP